LFAPGDVAGLVASLAKAIQQQAAGRRRASQARERFIAEYDVVGVAERIMAFYQAALDGPLIPQRD
jgi:hypothetical protein